MKHVLHLKCLICGDEYTPDEIEYICPNHGNEGIVDVRYDYELISHGLCGLLRHAMIYAGRRDLNREKMIEDLSLFIDRGFGHL